MAEQLDRAFLLRCSDEGSEVSEILILPSATDQEDNIFDTVVSDSQGSTEIPGLSGGSQESVDGSLPSSGEEGASDLSIDLESTLVSTSDRTAASNLLSCSSGREHNESPVSVESEGNGLSIHSIDSPPRGPDWSPPALSDSLLESAEDTEIMSDLSDIQINAAEYEPLQDSYLEATRFTDSLPTNFPNIQASILACLREVSNNPLIGHVPGPLTPDSSDVPANPMDILPLNEDSSPSDTEEEPLGYDRIWIEEGEPANEQHIPE